MTILQQWEVTQQQVELIHCNGNYNSKWNTKQWDNTTASDYASVVIGQYNSSGSSATSATSFSTSNTAFVIGNGTASSKQIGCFQSNV